VVYRTLGMHEKQEITMEAVARHTKWTHPTSHDELEDNCPICWGELRGVPLTDVVKLSRCKRHYFHASTISPLAL